MLCHKLELKNATLKIRIPSDALKYLSYYLPYKANQEHELTYWARYKHLWTWKYGQVYIFNKKLASR